MPIFSKVKSNNGVSGTAEVRVLPDSLRIMFLKDGQVVDTYNVMKDGWDRDGGIYKVTLARTNDAIKFIAPAGRDEPYLVKFHEFANRIGKDDTNPGVPQPKMKPGEMKNWPSGGSSYVPEHPVFNAKFIVIEKGAYNGLSINYELPYIFSAYPGTMSAMFAGTQSQNERMEKFLRVAGMDLLNDDIPMSDNVLPWLETRLQQLGKIFSVQLNDGGFVAKDGLRSIPAYLIPPELLEPAKPAKKAAAAKSNGKAKAGAKKAKATRK